MFGPYVLERRVQIRRHIELYRATSFLPDGAPRPVVLRRTRTLHDGVHDGFLDAAIRYAVIRHPNVAEVVDLGALDGRSYVATERIVGRDLVRVLVRCTHKKVRVPTDVALYILLEVLAALEAAHDARDRAGRSLALVHGDLCHSNIILTAEGEVRVTDFEMQIGSTRRRSPRGLHYGTRGTFTCYRSPEQLRGEAASVRSDLFSAGIVLYELLTGQALFRDSDERALVKRIADERFEVPLTKARADLHPELVRIVHTALAARPEDRFATAADLRAAIAALLELAHATVEAQFLARFLKRLFEPRAPREAA